MADDAPPRDEASYLAESQEGLLYAMFIIPIPLEILSTMFRLWVKARKTASRRIASDDYLMIFAVVMSVMVCVMGVSYGPSNGLGRHKEAVSDEELQAFRKGDYIFSHFYNLAIASTKLAVLALYHRIFETPLFRTLIIGTSSFIVAWILVMEIVMFAGCRPIQAWWGAVEGGTCVDKIAVTFFTNITNIVADLWIFAMPIPTIMRLQALRDRRASLCFLFSVGLGTCLISAARLAFIFAVGGGDITWWGGPLAILSCWEPCGGVLCANLPIVYKSFVQLLKQFGMSISGTSRTPTRDPHSKAQSQSGMYADGFHHHHRDWQRLNYSGGNVNGSKPALWASASANGVEGDSNDLELSGIVVQRDVTIGERRRSPMRRGSDTDGSSNVK